MSSETIRTAILVMVIYVKPAIVGRVASVDGRAAYVGCMPCCSVAIHPCSTASTVRSQVFNTEEITQHSGSVRAS
ncbi:hypothetical protein CPC08DRAFT_702803 [Agrocybe pediades]|nr:hypothetical protein CPC08DRAFT_702803 [Agrocybe pediades]